MAMKKKKISAMDVVLYTILAFVAAITLYPLLNLVAVSFSSRAAYVRNPLMILPADIDLGAYRSVSAA